MKRFLAGFVLGALLFSVPLAFAETPIRLVVNGKEISFPESPPAIMNNRVMVPARPLAEALGGKVTWDDANRTVVVKTSVYEEQETALADEYVFIRNLAIEYKWTVSNPDKNGIMKVLYGAAVLEIVFREGEPVVGTTADGCTVRGERVDHTLTLNQTDLKACDFIP